MVKTKLVGVDKLSRALQKKIGAPAVKQIISTNTARLQGKTVQNAAAAYTKGYSTGATGRSIRMELQDGGLTGVVGMGMDYDPYLEVGTRFMEAEPALKPAFNQVKTQMHNDINRLMK